MQHGTRKRALACALGLALAAALALPCGAASALGAGGSVGDGGGGAVDRVDEPFGQIVRIIPDVGMSALLFLPALPVDPCSRDEETGHPALQVLYVDRAYADAPGEWERWGTFEWDEGWQEYASGIDSIQPVYDDDFQNPTILYCTVSYSSDTVDYRDFYLRATAVTLENGALRTTAYEPALIEYEKEWLPDPPPDPDSPETPDEPDREPPNVVNPPAVDAGDGGGNRGGVGQGESVRVDPESSPTDLAPAAEKAVASPQGGDGATGDGETPGSESGEGDDPDAGESPDAGDGQAEPSAEREDAAATSAHDGADPSAAPASAPAAGETPDEGRIPGFVWAVGATAGTVAVAGGAHAALRARPRRPRKPRP